LATADEAAEQKSEKRIEKGVQEETVESLEAGAVEPRRAVEAAPTPLSTLREAQITSMQREAPMRVPSPPLLAQPKIAKPILDKGLPLFTLSSSVAPLTPSIPIIRLEPSRKVRAPALDKTVFTHPPSLSRNIAVPAIPRIAAPSIRPPLLDKTVPNVSRAGEMRLPVVTPPQVRAKPSVLRLDKNIYVAVKTGARIIQTAAAEAEAPSRMPGVGGAERKEAEKARVAPSALGAPPPLLRLLFRAPRGFKRRKFRMFGAGGLLRASPERPVIVVAVKPAGPEMKYRATLLTVLRELFRIKMGLPQIIAATARSEADVVQDHFMRGGIIKFVDDSEADLLFRTEKAEDSDKVDRYKLRSRLIELVHSGFSFLVLYVNEGKFEEVWSYLMALRGDLGRAKIIVVYPRRLTSNVLERLASAVWGFTKFRCFDGSIDGCFSAAEAKFYDVLEASASNPKYAKVRPSEGEGALHYMLKVFAYRHLVENLKLDPGDVETEYALPGGERPDIYVKSRGIAVEVETLYGSGVNPLSKLEEKVEKRMNIGVGEVWFVVPPLHLALFIRGFLKKYAEWRSKYGDRVKVFTVDLALGALIPIEDFAEKLRSIARKITEERAHSAE